MSCSLCTCFGYLALIPLAWFVFKKIYGKWKNKKMAEKLERWSETPKDVVIIHTTRRGKTLPSPSPFALKLETYLRMAGIKYEIDLKDRYGLKSKFPWISINGEHVTDSQFIIEFISKKFEKNFSQNIDKKALATATLCRVVLEEHFFWGMAMERLVFGGRHHLVKFVQFSPIFIFLFKIYGHYELTRRSKAQGIGLHCEDEIVHLMKKDLRAISTLLGHQKFICGNEPCEEDCAIFGMLAQIVWTLPNSAYDDLIKDELPNLKDYCYRMKDKFWPDWDKVIGT